MSGAEFKTWLDANRLSVTDVQSETTLSRNAIYAFLNDEEVHPATAKMLEWFKERVEHRLSKFKAVS
jgi:hypothetical protein